MYICIYRLINWILKEKKCKTLDKNYRDLETGANMQEMHLPDGKNE